MVSSKVLDTLAELEQEMARAGRTSEEEALRAARRALLQQSGREFLTIAQAAERLGVSKATVKQWLKRGTLTGYQWNGRWCIVPSDVEHLIGLRAALRDMDLEGNPTQEEILALYRRPRRSSEIESLATSEP